MKGNNHTNRGRVYVLLLFSFIITNLAANSFTDTLKFNRKAVEDRQLFLFSAGYRLPIVQSTIINSGHGICIEGGINAGRFISKDLVLGLYGGYALQDRFWSTSFSGNFSNDYNAAINKEQRFSALDSAILYSSADLFKNARGNAGVIPGCASQSFHNYSLYYGLVFRLPFKYSPIVKVYRGSTRSHFQGDGNLVTKHREYNIFELRRNMTGCEVGLAKAISKNRDAIGISAYFEVCNFYNATIYFDDGSVTRNISVKSFVSDSFLKKYQSEVYWGIKLFYSIM